MLTGELVRTVPSSLQTGKVSYGVEYRGPPVNQIWLFASLAVGRRVRKGWRQL